MNPRRGRRSFRRPAARAVCALLFGTLAALAFGGCGRGAPTGAARTTRVDLGVRFAAGAGPVGNAIPAGIDSLEIASWALTQAGEKLLSSQGFRVDATTGEIRLDLRVPLATGYRISSAALGLRDRVFSPAPGPARAGLPIVAGLPIGTTYGIQFFRSKLLDAGLGPAASLELVMEDVVPRAVRFQGQFGDSLHWPPVPAARSYVVRAFNFTGAPPVDIATTDTLLYVPFGASGYFRVSSELGNGLSSAFSEIP